MIRRQTGTARGPDRGDAHPAPGEAGVTVAVTGDPGADRLRAWDDLVRSCPLADVAQLSAWARLRARVGYRARYVIVERTGRPVAGAQVLVRRVPALGEVGYVPYGPLVLPGRDDDPVVQHALARGLRTLAQTSERMLFVQPPDGGHRTAEALRAVGFRDSTAEVAPAASLHVDLTVDEEQLRRGLSRRLQTWTRVWHKRGVTVRRGGEADLPRLAELLAATADHQGFVPFGLDYLEAMEGELGPGGHLVTFVGEVEGRPVAMAMLTACGTVLRSRLVGLERTTDTHRLNVSAAVFWHAMRWAKSQGYRWFDFGGLLPESVPAMLGDGPPDLAAVAGMDRYKARFGATAYRCPAPLELIPSPVLRAGYDLARRTSAGSRLIGTAQRVARAGGLRAQRRAGGKSR